MGKMMEEVLTGLQQDPRFRDRLVHLETLPARGPVHGTPADTLPEPLRQYLAKKNLELYSHQAEAVDALGEGANVIITTPTASGKTLAYTVPIFREMIRDPRSAALFLYPTKALANDQMKVLREMEKATGIDARPAVYDGDTPASRRPGIRERSRIILSNPHELHQILPWHSKWQPFLRNLKFVVLDEAHRYRGVLGSNMAFLIRRLRRLARSYGSDPRFVLSSATLANPQEFSERLTGLPFRLIDRDGSPRGKKYFLFYNPYFDGAGTLSTHQETRDLFLFFLRRRLQTLCFTASRKMAELIAQWSKKSARESDPDLADRIAAYRAGYLPEERRELENQLKRGALLGVTSTNALELGIDVGSLDCVIISGYPGTVISTWQQAGRSGRGTGESAAALVAFENPLDQYFMRHPGIFFGRPHEHAIIDLGNPHILSGQLLCAAAEMPLRPGEERIFESTLPAEQGRRKGGEPDLTAILSSLEKEGLVQETPHGWVYSGRSRATEIVSLDRISSDAYRVLCGGETLETMDQAQAFREAHPGAVLLHQGETYIAEEMDLRNHVVRVKKGDVDYYTEAVKTADLKILRELERRVTLSSSKGPGASLVFGDLEVTERYVGYRIIQRERLLGMEKLDLPPLTFKTTGVWVHVSEDTMKIIAERNRDAAGGLHGAEHALIAVMPFHVLCDRWDMGGLSTPLHPDTLRPAIFVYDGFEGGIGLAEKAFDLFGEIASMAFELVRDCPCEEGCPACIYSPKCGNDNKPLDKEAARIILEKIRN
jgi:DEAD/DEAH box helicase domain-containing protein